MPKGKDTILKKIYFEPDEWKEVERRAALIGKRPTAYVREMAVYGEVKIFDFSEYQTMIFPLRGISANINQIAKVANSMGEVYKKDIEDIKESFRQLREMFDAHFKELKYKRIG